MTMKLPSARGGTNAPGPKRPWIVAVGAVPLVAVALSGQFLAPPAASAAHRSPCESGTNVGEQCRYFQVVSAGPRFEATGWLANQQGGHLYDWHEKDETYTQWWYRFSDANPSSDTMNVVITVRGTTWGLPETSWPVTESHCYLVTNDSRVSERACPA
jgi:hypothetical protein